MGKRPGANAAIARAPSLHKTIFLSLVAAVIGARALTSGSPLFAIGASLVEVLLALAIGRVALWFGDKFYLFVRNAARPDSARKEIERTIWQTHTLSLVVGLPLAYFLRSLSP